MNREELRHRLAEEGIAEAAFDFENGQKDEVYCLEEHPPGWAYYFRERGIRRDQRFFTSEHDACIHFLAEVLRDPTTRLTR